MSNIEVENAFSILERKIKDSIQTVRKEISSAAIHNNTLNEISALAEKAKQYENIIKQLNSIKIVLEKLEEKKERGTRKYKEEGGAHKGERTPITNTEFPS